MLLLYPQYFRQHGVRRPVQLVAPTLSRMETLDIPQGSILHFVADDEALYGMPQDDYILRHVTRMMYVDHNKELGDTKGNPRRTQLPPNQMIRDYQRKYRRTRALVNLPVTLRDPRTLIIENYALLPHLYRYTTSYFRNYYKWWNIQAALWKRVGEIGAMSDRQQYLECYLPTILPSLTQLRKGEVYTNRSTINAFPENASLFILELWKWLGEHRHTSVLAMAPPAAIAKMNLIWTESGKWFVINLGLLDQWRKPSKQELEAGADAHHGLIDPQRMQRRFLRALMFLYECRSAAGGEPKPVAEATVVAETQYAETQEPTGEVKAVDAPLKIVVPHAEDSNRTRTVTVKPGLNIDNLPENNALIETEHNMQLIDEAISKDLEALSHLHLEVIENDIGDHDGEPPETIPTPTLKYEPEERTLEGGVISKADDLADQGALSGAEYRRFMTLASAYQKIPDPYGKHESLAAQAVIKPEHLTIPQQPIMPDSSSIIDKSMLKSSLSHFDKKYVEEVLPKDVSNVVLSLQHGGVAVAGYQVEHIEDALNSYVSHTINIVPVRGKASTIRFRLPKVAADGTFKSGGVRYRLRKQRGDLPIRKLSPDKVALTSYYSKVFVSRSDKQVHNYPDWLTNQIALRGMDPANEDVTHLMVSNVFKSENRTPRLYSILAARFRSFDLPRAGLRFFLDYNARYMELGEERVKAAEKDGMVVIGRSDGYPRSLGKDAYALLVVDQNDVLYTIPYDSDELVVRGTMETLLDLDRRKAPSEVAVVKVFGKFIPVGMFLAYQMGLTRLCEVLGVNPRRVPSGERVNLSDDEYLLKFHDEQLVFPKENRLAAVVLSGIASFENATSNYSVHQFDRKDIYLNVLEQAGMGVRYLREMDLLVDMFVDPITRELLVELQEPTDFIGLVIRACELLMTDWSPAETDMAYMRIKGYERMAGAVYTKLVEAMRAHRARGSNAAAIELPPYAVWQAITGDSAIKQVEDSNPVHNLKEREEVTYSGTGGRSARSMVSRTRVFHPNDQGVISEATKDSADVAITTFLTADPHLKNLRGITGRYEKGKVGATSLMSTSALLAPAADRDDPKRVNFISIQQSAGTFAKGYRPSPMRTGYEQVMAHRTDDLYAYTADGAGTITRVTPKAVTVTYDDGQVTTVQLGRRFGVAAGTVMPHSVTTPLAQGARVAEGDIVAYNTNYFQLDALNPRQVVWKAGVLVRTAILESTDTLEDSSAISKEVAELMETQITKPRDIVIGFTDTVHNLLPVGTAVEVESILCTIEDAVSAQSNSLDDESLDTLRLIASNTPRAKVKGVIEHIEVFYNGDIDELSPSLQELAQASDRDRKRLARELGTTYTSGRVFDDSLRVDGNPLPADQLVIRVFITQDMADGVGDKGVFANQMKTIHGSVLTGRNETESGEPIGAFFAGTSISDRIVDSPIVQGTTNTLLIAASMRVVNAYYGKLQ